MKTQLSRRLAASAPVDPKRFHSAPAVKAVIDFHPGNMAATSGMIGAWSVTYHGADGKQVGGLLAGQMQILADAKACGFKASALVWTEAARREAWRAFRAAYPRRRRGH